MTRSLLLALGLSLASCVYEGDILVKNEVSNCTVTEINFDGNNLYGALITGQSKITKIEDDKENWPKSGPITFVMIANNKRVYLQTKASYTLNADGDLTVIISDTTQVVNP